MSNDVDKQDTRCTPNMGVRMVFTLSNALVAENVSRVMAMYVMSCKHGTQEVCMVGRECTRCR